ncbi:MAG: sigma-70 family RNA polymerase sigma factor, partial [Blautia wexlerae]
MVIFAAPVSHCGELAFFIVDFSGKLLKYVAADPRLLSIHSSITRESKWRYIMKKINLRELYPDVYTTDFFVDVTEKVME